MVGFGMTSTTSLTKRVKPHDGQQFEPTPTTILEHDDDHEGGAGVRCARRGLLA
jgi:hypothetical protein